MSDTESHGNKLKYDKRENNFFVKNSKILSEC